MARGGLRSLGQIKDAAARAELARYLVEPKALVSPRGAAQTRVLGNTPPVLAHWLSWSEVDAYLNSELFRAYDYNATKQAKILKGIELHLNHPLIEVYSLF